MLRMPFVLWTERMFPIYLPFNPFNSSRICGVRARVELSSGKRRNGGGGGRGGGYGGGGRGGGRGRSRYVSFILFFVVNN